MRYVVIVDPGIKVDKGYPAYDRGLKADIFVKDITGMPYLGQVHCTPISPHLPPLILTPLILARLLENSQLTSLGTLQSIET